MPSIRVRLDAVQGRLDQAEAALAKTERTGFRLDRLREQLANLQAERVGILEEQAELIESCRKAVYHEAIKFVHVNPTLSKDDLVSAGFVGLTLAAQLFEPERGLKFTTYAITCIWAHIVREAKTDGRLIAIPVHYHVGLRARREGREPPRPMPYLDDAERAMRPIRSLDTWGVDHEDDRSPLDQMVIAEEKPSYDSDELERLREALARLPARERNILLERMHGRNLNEIGMDHGICKERVRQIEALALERMKEMLLPGYEIKRRARTPRQCRTCQRTQTQHEVGRGHCSKCGRRFHGAAQSA